MKAISSIPKLRDQFEHLEMKPANCFAKGCFMRKSFGDKLRHGAQLPQVWLRGEATGGIPGLSDDLLGSGLLMLGFGTAPEQHLAEADAQAWRRMGGRFVTIVPCGHRTGESLEDYTGALIPSVVPTGWIATIRPDKTVLHDGHASRARAILRDSMALMA
jgi:3-(3-hydroxy-phenyl)propionate hydroxylase